jgi:hypothetical protein
VKFVLVNFLIALHATLNAAQSTVQLVIGVVGLNGNLLAVSKFAHAPAQFSRLHLVVELSAHLL